MHTTLDPAILYFGTPVVLVSSLNDDGTTNLAPMSSAWWLGYSCMLGFGARSHTPQNILRQKECVLNLPSVEQVAAVDRLARTTGSSPVPDYKQPWVTSIAAIIRRSGINARRVRDGGAAAGVGMSGAPGGGAGRTPRPGAVRPLSARAT